MMCYKDRSFCSSQVEIHTCGREITKAQLEEAQELELSICYGSFCGTTQDTTTNEK